MRTHTFGADGTTLGVVGQGTWYLDEARRADAIAARREAALAADVVRAGGGRCQA